MNATIPGTIIAYGGSPDSLNQLERLGWLLCNGALYDRTNPKYKPLFDHIGTIWGGDGANKFAVPDLRGLFLRGTSEQSNNDPDKMDRLASRPDLSTQGARGNATGSKQSDMVGPVAARNTLFQQGHVDFDNPGQGAILRAGGTFNNDVSTRPTEPISTGSETRPKNAYVYYIISL